EILSAIQDRIPNAPILKPEQLGALRTLGEIARALGNPGAGMTVNVPEPASDLQADALRAAEPAGRRCDYADTSRSSNGANGFIAASRAVPERTERIERCAVRGTNGSVGSGKVILVEQQPRAVSLVNPQERPEVQLPDGGDIWITDDGSGLSATLCRCLNG